MSQEFRVFRLFQLKEEALEFKGILEKNSIELKLIDNSPSFDPSFSGNTIQNNFQILIKQVDFQKANKLLEEKAEADLSLIDKNYHLYNFSTQELIEILTKPDEWSEIDYALSKKILKEKGEGVSDAKLEELKVKRTEELIKPSTIKKSSIYISILLGVLGFILYAFILFIPLFWGWYVWNFKKTIPNGEKVFYYSKQSRKYGKTIFFIGVLFTSLWFIILLTAPYLNEMILNR